MKIKNNLPTNVQIFAIESSVCFKSWTMSYQWATAKMPNDSNWKLSPEAQNVALGEKS